MRMRAMFLVVVALALATAGGATAGKKGPAAGLLKGKALVKQSAVYLGVSVKDVRTQLRSGKSLAQVADATPGKSSSGLLAALTDAAKTKLDALVTAGKLKPERESKVLDRLTKRLTRAIARVHQAKS